MVSAKTEIVCTNWANVAKVTLTQDAFAQSLCRHLNKKGVEIVQ